MARHGREFPALPESTRAAILEGFNASNRWFFSGTMGFRVVDLREGYARLVAENTTAHQQPAGVMHGGASFGLADTAVAAALFTVYGAGQLLLTIEMKINFLEPIPRARSWPRPTSCARAGGAPTPRSTSGRRGNSPHAPAPPT